MSAMPGMPSTGYASAGVGGYLPQQGWGVFQAGQNEEGAANQGLDSAASMEAQQNEHNTLLAAQEKAGSMASLANIGGKIGGVAGTMLGGPVGGIVGSMGGSLLGGVL